MNIILTIIFIGFLLIKWGIGVEVIRKPRLSTIRWFVLLTLCSEIIFVIGNLLLR